MNSKTINKFFFSGKEEDFVYFSEQFEARRYVLELNKILDGTVGYRDFIPTLRGGPSHEQIDANRNGKQIFDEKQMAIWYELVRCLDKKSVLFLQPYRGKRSEASSVLCKRFKSFERPRLQKLISDLKNLRKYNNESIVDYITRAEDMQLNLFEIDESISEKMFFSILLKGLPREFESFCTLVKYGQDKTLDEIKRDLINFESEKRNDRNTEKSESVFFTNDRTCFNCHKRGHIAKFCRAQPSEPNKEKPNSKITCFKCKKIGHIAKNCFTYKKFESHAMKNE